MGRTISLTVGRLPGAIPDRDDLVLGVDQPGPSNTGVYAGIARTEFASNPVAGGLYQNLDIMADIHLPSGPPAADGSNDINYVNCFIRGSNTIPTGFTAQVVATNTGDHPNVNFIDCTFEPRVPHLFRSLLLGYGVRMYRCDISQVVDGWSVFRTTAGHQADPSRVIAEQNWIHDHQWSNHDAHTAAGISSNADGGHPDCIQIQGMSGQIFRGNFFDGHMAPEYGLNFYNSNTTNSCIIIKPDVGVITGVVIEKNWLSGGAAGVNITSDPPDRFITDVGSIKNNIFYHDARGFDFVKPDEIACDIGTGALRNFYLGTTTEITYTRGA